MLLFETMSIPKRKDTDW